MIDTTRTLPCDLNIEAMVLGSLITYPALIAQSFLKPIDFYKTEHRHVFECIKEMCENSEFIDALTVANKIKTEFKDITDPELLLAGLLEVSCNDKSIELFSKQIVSLRIKRDLLCMLSDVSKKCYDESNSIVNILENIQYFTDKGIEEIDNIDQESTTPRSGRVIPKEETFNQFADYATNGLDLKGLSTGWESLDAYYKICKGMLNVLTGIPGHGKSEFLDALMVNTAKIHGWTWLVFSPENYPQCLHIQKFVEKHSGYKYKNIPTVKEYEECLDFVLDKFRIVDLHEDNYNLNALLSIAKKYLSENKIDGIVIDPWNELNPQPINGESETEYVGRSLSKIRRFARKNKICVFIVAHPAKMYKKEGATKYDVPTLYNISGSAHWFNKADNGLCVYRDLNNTDVNVELHIQKVKFKIHGFAGNLVEFNYDVSNGRYTEKSAF